MIPPILGITGYYLEPAAAVLVDCHVRAAYREADLVGRPVSGGFPSRAVARCLQDAGLTSNDIAYVGFADRPQARFRQVIAKSAGAGFAGFRQAVLPWLKSWLHVGALLRRDLVSGSRAAVLYADFHEALLAAAYFSSPFPEAAVLTLDGVGTHTGGAIGVGQGGRVRLTQRLPGPFSLPALMVAVADAVKLSLRPVDWRELAQRGTPRFEDLFWQRVLEAHADGSFRWRSGLIIAQGTGPSLDASLRQQLMTTDDRTRADIVASVWSICRELTRRAALHALARTGLRQLAVAGDWTVHWIDANALHATGDVDAIWIPPGTPASAAAGVAWLVHHHVLAAPRVVRESVAV